MNPENEFDIPAAASTPQRQTIIAAQTAQTKAVIPPPVVTAPEPAPQAAPESLPAPATFAEALALVQKLQREYESMPNGTRSQQRERWFKGQLLEQAKAHAARIQQGPEPQSITECAQSLVTLEQRVALQPVDTIRQQVLARMAR